MVYVEMAATAPTFAAQEEPRWEISACTVADAPGLAAATIPAFWANPHWQLAWTHRTLEHQIEQATKRGPRNLIKDRATKRQEKATDKTSGRIMGTARWIIPLEYTTTSDGSPVWPEAVVPAVSAEEEAEFYRIAATADWNPQTESDVLDLPAAAAKAKMLAAKPYMNLDYLAVHPDFQKQGVASALVLRGLEEAEKLGLDVLVHAFEVAVGLYKRLGFRVEQEFAQDSTRFGGPGVTTCAMMIFEQKEKTDAE